MSKEVAKHQNQVDMFKADVVPDYVDTSKQEQMSVDDIEIPRLGLCQALSDVRKKTSPNYIPGIEEGDFFNTVTREIYGKSVVVVPVHYQKDYIVWLDRDKHSGNGFRGSFSSISEAQAHIKQLPDQERAIAEIVETPVFLCLLVGGDRTEEIVVSLPKSGWRVARRWNSLVRLAGGPRYSRGYMLESVEIDGAKGNYYSAHVKQLGYTPEEIYRRAEEIAQAISAGDKEIKYSYDETSGSDDDSSEDDGVI